MLSVLFGCCGSGVGKRLSTRESFGGEGGGGGGGWGGGVSGGFFSFPK